MINSAAVTAIGVAVRHDGRCSRKTPPSQAPRRNSDNRTSGFSDASAACTANDGAAARVAPAAISTL
jgi:hypothetical protein